jgi:hypothetical protein
MFHQLGPKLRDELKYFKEEHVAHEIEFQLIQLNLKWQQKVERNEIFDLQKSSFGLALNGRRPINYAFIPHICIIK